VVQKRILATFFTANAIVADGCTPRINKTGLSAIRKLCNRPSPTSFSRIVAFRLPAPAPHDAVVHGTVHAQEGWRAHCAVAIHYPRAELTGDVPAPYTAEAVQAATMDVLLRVPNIQNAPRDSSAASIEIESA
jgi:hypothetical protein